jgi:cytochrome P450
MDLMADFAYELPLRMICRIVGIPDTDVYSFRTWTQELLAGQAFDASDEVKDRGDAAAIAFRERLGELIAFYRANPNEGLLSALIAATEDGDTLTDAEIVTVMGGLIAAGHETSTAMIGNLILALLRNPDELHRLCEDSSLMPTAVEEGLRYEGPPVWVPRFALEGLTVGGVEFPPGAQLSLFIASANRDPDVFEDAEEFQIRPRAKGHLSFAAGDRFCLGSNLARAEVRGGVDALIRYFPKLELAADDVEYVAFGQVRQLAALPVRWEPSTPLAA